MTYSLAVETAPIRSRPRSAERTAASASSRSPSTRRQYPA